MATRRQPFNNSKDDDEYFKLIIDNRPDKFWKKHAKNNKECISMISEELKSLIILLLQYDPIKRPSLSEIQEHEWFRGCIPTKDAVKEEFM